MAKHEQDTRWGEGVGRTETQIARIVLPPGGLKLENGGVLPELEIAYESYGTLSPQGDNVVFICTALTGDAHAAGYHTDPARDTGWWDAMIGPGRGIDTRYYHVICANILGGCKGTTGPASRNPLMDKPYGADFPVITVGDIVDVHVLLLRHLGVEKLAAVIGGSFGGMQVLEWLVRYPAMVDHAVCIATAACLSAQALAFDSLARTMITEDAGWYKGDYYAHGEGPVRGLAHARQLGHITYLSQEIMMEKFGRERRDLADEDLSTARIPEFQVASYLAYQGQKFVSRFDANSYLRIMMAMDQFDLKGRSPGGLEGAFAAVSAKVLVVAVKSDWLFPPAQSKEIAHALLRAGKNVSYCQLDAPYGHDAFLVDIDNLVQAVSAFLPWVADGEGPADALPREKETAPLPFSRVSLAAMIRRHARVLDVGCGDGRLLAELGQAHDISGFGVDIDFSQVVRVMNRGYAVFQANIDSGLAMIPDNSYDYAILSETLQVVRHPRMVMQELLRVARECIVTFPNFAHYRFVGQLLRQGRMPVGDVLPWSWYDTPNIHLFTLRDFESLCAQENWKIEERVCGYDGVLGRLLGAMGCANRGAARILLRVTR
ncbi:MAG: homoserine O-acetyltransferase MetX [Kiritimatiellia bacterium]